MLAKSSTANVPRVAGTSAAVAAAKPAIAVGKPAVVVRTAGTTNKPVMQAKPAVVQAKPAVVASAVKTGGAANRRVPVTAGKKPVAAAKKPVPKTIKPADHPNRIAGRGPRMPVFVYPAAFEGRIHQDIPATDKPPYDVTKDVLVGGGNQTSTDRSAGAATWHTAAMEGGNDSDWNAEMVPNPVYGNTPRHIRPNGPPRHNPANDVLFGGSGDQPPIPAHLARPLTDNDMQRFQDYHRAAARRHLNLGYDNGSAVGGNDDDSYLHGGAGALETALSGLHSTKRNGGVGSRKTKSKKSKAKTKKSKAKTKKSKAKSKSVRISHPRRSHSKSSSASRSRRSSIGPRLANALGRVHSRSASLASRMRRHHRIRAGTPFGLGPASMRMRSRTPILGTTVIKSASKAGPFLFGGSEQKTGTITAKKIGQKKTAVGKVARGPELTRSALERGLAGLPKSKTGGSSVCGSKCAAKYPGHNNASARSKCVDICDRYSNAFNATAYRKTKSGGLAKPAKSGGACVDRCKPLKNAKDLYKACMEKTCGVKVGGASAKKSKTVGGMDCSSKCSLAAAACRVACPYVSAAVTAASTAGNEAKPAKKVGGNQRRCHNACNRQFMAGTERHIDCMRRCYQQPMPFGRRYGGTESTEVNRLRTAGWQVDPATIPLPRSIGGGKGKRDKSGRFVKKTQKKGGTTKPVF